MLEIRPIMNSSVEDVLAFKTCCGLKMNDQNLEIHVINHGDSAVYVLSLFDLEGETGTERIETLMPPGGQKVEPGQIVAFYCSMDETVWRKYRSLVFYDRDGGAYRTEINAKGAGEGDWRELV